MNQVTDLNLLNGTHGPLLNYIFQDSGDLTSRHKECSKNVLLPLIFQVKTRVLKTTSYLYDLVFLKRSYFVSGRTRINNIKVVFCRMSS